MSVFPCDLFRLNLNFKRFSDYLKRMSVSADYILTCMCTCCKIPLALSLNRVALGGVHTKTLLMSTGYLESVMGVPLFVPLLPHMFLYLQ